MENGNITLFVNGSEQVDAEYSRVLEIDTNTRQIVWQYQGTSVDTFFSPRVSGAHGLPNGNTHICERRHGRLFEVTPGGEIVWEYVSPYTNTRGTTVTRQIFRSLRCAIDSPEIAGRVELAV